MKDKENTEMDDHSAGIRKGIQFAYMDTLNHIQERGCTITELVRYLKLEIAIYTDTEDRNAV